MTRLGPSGYGAALPFDDRVQAVAKKGFTERQARFLTIVMLHAGVCVPRQYARFCGIVHGAKTRKFFARHAALLRAFPAWTLRIVVPPQWPDAARRSKLAVWSQLLTPLPDEKLGELRWYFEHLRTHPMPLRGDDLDERFHKARAAFSGPRFKALYRTWKQDGEAALVSAGSRALGDAVQSGAGRVETLELGHRYGHLSPLVAVA